MTTCLTFDHISAATPDGRTLFSDLTTTINTEAVGLVGRNGCGKSTLLAIAAGSLSPLTGTITRSGRLAVLEQVATDTGTIANALGVSDALACLARMENGEGSLDDAASADWLLPSRLDAALADFGLTNLPMDSPVDRLSGGERTRLSLVRLMLTEPDIILLDEPTNNLDHIGRQVISDLIARFDGAVLVASHDRELLDRMDRIIHLAPTGITHFTGTWSQFEVAQDEHRARLEAQRDRASQALSRQKQDIQRHAQKKAQRDRQGRARRARNADPKMLLDARKNRAEQTSARDSRLADRQMKAVESTLQSANEQIEIITPLTIDMPQCQLPASRTVLRVIELEHRFGDRKLFGPLSFAIEGPQRWAISGANGSGKSTLLKLITEEIAIQRGWPRPLPCSTSLPAAWIPSRILSQTCAAPIRTLPKTTPAPPLPALPFATRTD